MKTALSVASLSLLLILTRPNRSEGQGASASIAITEDGVGPLTSGTPFKISVIAKLFPELKVVAGVDSTEGTEFPTIEVRDGVGVLLEIIPIPGTLVIGNVIAKRKLVTSAGKGQIGSLYPQVFGEGLSTGCYAGHEEMAADLICAAPGSNAILLVFSGPFDINSPSSTALRKMRIREIYWSPPQDQK